MRKKLVEFFDIKTESFFNIAGVMFIVLDNQGRILRINKKGCNILEYPEKDILGKNWFDYFLPLQYREEVRKVYNQLITGKIKPAEYYENPVLTKSGQEKIIAWHNAILRDKEKNIIGTLSSGEDITEKKKSGEKINYLTQVLRAVRNVNQFITREKDKSKLISRACKLLTETGGFEKAWIIILDENNKPTLSAEIGMGKKFTEFITQMRKGRIYRCCSNALEQSEIILIDNTKNDCRQCPIFELTKDKKAMTVRLEYKGKIYGLLSVILPAHFAVDKEGQGLFSEIASDISFAIYSIEVEKQQEEVIKLLKKSQEIANIGSWSFDLKNNHLTWSDEVFRIFGLDPQKFEPSYEKFLTAVHPEDREKVDQAYKKSVKNKQSYSMEHRILRPDGTVRIVQEKGEHIADRSGKICISMGMIHDITVRAEVEKDLQQSNEKYHLLVENVPSVLWKTSEKGITVFISPNIKEVYGYTPKEIYKAGYKYWFERVHQDDIKKVKKRFKQLFTEGKKYNVEYRIKRKDGKWIWIHDLADVVLKENEERYAYGVFTDITGRKKAEYALRESEERFRKSIMKAPFPAMVHAEDGEVILVNKVWETISGYRLKEIPTISNWTAKVYGQEKKKVEKDIEKLYKQTKKVNEGEYTIKTKSGKNLVWHFSSSPLDRDEKGRKLFLSMAHDITEQKKTEERRKQILRELNFINTTIIKISRMQSINKICEYIGNVIHKLNPNSYVAVSLYDPEVKAVTIRTLVGFEEYIDRLLDMTGKDPISIAFHPGEMDSIVSLYTSGKLEYIPGGLYVLMEEKIPKVICRAVEKLLGIDKCYTVGFALKDKPYGGITILTAKGQDISYKSAIETITSHLSEILHRRQIERALEVSEERFRLAAEAVSDMVYEWDIKTDTLNWFGSLEKTLGYKEGEIKYTLQGLFELIHPTEREKIRKTVEKYRTSFKPGRDEYRIRKKDGSWRYWVDQGVPLLNDEGRPCKRIGACVDITDQQKAKEQIKKDLKEKDVLLKEIHHRVKNNLNVIVSLLNLQSNQIENKKQALTAFNETKDRVYSMALVHDQLYKSDSFSHINMNNYIRTMVRGLLSSFSKSKKITLDMNVKDIFLDINKAIPCGLLLNEIITNALKHAFPNRITGKISIEFSMKDHTYELRVKDNGIGIPENIDIDEVKTLGLKLINLLTEQIEGKLDIKRKYGTQFTVIFSENAA